jgi:hypothetical protein
MKLENFEIHEVELKTIKGGGAMSLTASISKTFDTNTLTVRPQGNSDDGDDNADDPFGA